MRGALWDLREESRRGKICLRLYNRFIVVVVVVVVVLVVAAVVDVAFDPPWLLLMLILLAGFPDDSQCHHLHCLKRAGCTGCQTWSSEKVSALTTHKFQVSI